MSKVPLWRDPRYIIDRLSMLDYLSQKEILPSRLIDRILIAIEDTELEGLITEERFDKKVLELGRNKAIALIRDLINREGLRITDEISKKFVKESNGADVFDCRFAASNFMKDLSNKYVVRFTFQSLRGAIMDLYNSDLKNNSRSYNQHRVTVTKYIRNAMRKTDDYSDIFCRYIDFHIALYYNVTTVRKVFPRPSKSNVKVVSLPIREQDMSWGFNV